MVLIKLVLEPTEPSPPLKRPGQAPAGRIVADALSETGHVLIPDVRRDRIDGNEVQLVDLDGVLAVDACVAGPERHLSRSRVEQSTVLIVGLIRERSCDLLNVDSAEVEHLLRLEPESSVLAGCKNRAEPGVKSRRDDASSTRSLSLDRGAVAEVTGSFARLHLDRLEVAYGVAVVLPLLPEDHVHARQSGLLVFGIPRVLARRGQLV